MKKVYAGIVLVGMIAVALLTTGCPNPTSDDPVYSIGLEPTGSVVFTGATVGYPTQTARTVTVTNTGNQDTGELAIEKTGTGAARFTVSKSSLAGIVAGGTDTFTVVPNRSLATGTYTATITVRGEHDISASFNVSFTVSPRAEYSIALSKTGTHNFPPAIVDYTAQTVETVTVTNTGNQSTGSLTITNSNAAGFTVSKTSAADLVANGTDTFTVVPATGLAVGTYTATITVSGGNDLSASLNVSFRVNPTTPVYSVDLSETEPYEFPGAEAGYEEQEAITVTVTNTGNRATGALTIASSPANFTVTPASLAGIEESATGSFTVAPKTGLRAGTYDSTITVSGSGGISAGFAVSFTVTPAYSVSLSETGTYVFPGTALGYGAQTARSVTIRNTGDAATGALTIASGSDSFVVSKAGITDLALNGTDTFTVAPKAGLPAGSYTGTITVGGGNIPSAGFDVSFTVAAASYGISLSETGTYTFPAAFAGYGAPALAERIKSISVTNTGNQATGALTIAKSEPNNATNFTVSETGIESIPNGGTGGFTVVPNAALPARAAAYTATITVSGGNSITASFIVSFTVNASGATPYAIELDGVTGGIHTFLAAIEGYGAQTAKSVTVRNTGSAATEALDIAISGTDANDFVVSLVGPAAIADIGISASDSFTVFPRTGLIYVLGKTYEATITVSSATHTAINEQFEVKFEVIEPYYEVSLNQTGTYLFPPAYPNYGQQRALTVTVANEGNLPTGTLDITISSAYPGYFTAPDTLDSIAVHGTGRFTVAPITGHPLGGPYDATIEVSSVAHPTISEQFDVRFTVTTAPVISLGETGYDFPAVTVGYGAAPPAKTVTVTNTGDKDTGALTIRKTGANPGSFAVSKNSIATPGIEVGQNDSFTVVPITGLSAKDTPYTATITVGGEGIITQTFDVSFTVKPVYHTVTFSAPGSMPTISTAQAIHNSTVNSLPSDPGRNGYTFAGWYTTPETGGSKFTTATRVSAPITVYARWLSSNAGLAALSVSQGELDPAFASYITNYSVTVPNTVASINVSATPADGKARYERYPSGNSVSLNAGLNVITVKVIAEDGTTSTDYTIAVTREQPLSANANLSSLGVSVGMLSPAFSPNITAYTVTVPTATSAITVSAAAADAWNVATIAQSPGNALGDPVDLESPSTAIAITVTAANGDAKAYTITVKKEAGNNAVNVFIGITDKYIDLARDTENDLSQALNNSLSLTAPDGYQNYAWLVDGNSTGNNTQNIVLNHGGRSLGTHSVLLTFEDAGGAKYGCEVLFRVAR